MHHTTRRPEALSRTWETVTEYAPYGEKWGISRQSVTLSRAYVGAPLSAEIDGKPAALEQAVSIIRRATRATVTAETLEQLPAAAPIGKQAARTLHVDLARLGFRKHYETAADALGRPVASLADLTAAESATVRSYARGQWGMV